MHLSKKHTNQVNESAAEAYEIPTDKKVSQFLEVAHSLPSNRLQEILDTLEQVLRNKTEDFDFSLFLLEGPIMSDSQFASFKEQRKNTNQWREKQSF
jgi:hypothetical protein